MVVITEDKLEMLVEDLHGLLPICDLTKDWYYIQSIEYMRDGRYFITMKSEVNVGMYKEVVCVLEDNGEFNPLVVLDAEFALHGSPCISESVYINE